MQVFSETTCEDVAGAGVMTVAECGPLLLQYQAGWQRMFDASEAGYRLTVAGSKHNSFSDLPFIAPLIPAFASGGDISPDRVWEISTQYALAFFNRYLKDAREPFPDFPETLLEVASHH